MRTLSCNAAAVALLLLAGCASAPPGPAELTPQEESKESNEEALAEVAADAQCGSGTDRPCFISYDKAPVLANQRIVSRALTTEYPARLRDRGIGGRVVVWLFLDERGQHQRVLLKHSSGNRELDRAAMRVARMMRFDPALKDGTPVKVWVEIPLDFIARR